MSTSPQKPGLTPQQAADAAKRAEQEGYVRRLPVELDIGADELAGGPMDETISTRMNRWSQMSGVRGFIGKWANRLNNVLFPSKKGPHGPLATAGDMGRAEAEVERDKQALGEDSK